MGSKFTPYCIDPPSDPHHAAMARCRGGGVSMTDGGEMGPLGGLPGMCRLMCIEPEIGNAISYLRHGTDRIDDGVFFKIFAT